MTAPLLCILGPTASGKTALAVDLCRRYDAELVGADASQVYRGMDIGTGKATAAERQGVRHHLLDVVAPDEPFDAKRYVTLADAAIADIHARGKRAIVCGGTGLYVQALLKGLCEAPPADEITRDTLRARIEAGEVETLHAELAAIDPEAGARIGAHDAQRIERALGVFLTSGRPLSAWQREHRFAEARYPSVVVALEWPRAALNARIERRTEAMFDGGFIEEVEALVAAGYGGSLQSMGAIGYRFVGDLIAGRLHRAEALRRTQAGTRRYAKRQMTWFRKQAEVRWLMSPVDLAQMDTLVAPLWGTPQQSKETGP